MYLCKIYVGEGLVGQGVVDKYEQVDGAIADWWDNVIFGEEFDKISQLEIKAGEETYRDEVIEQGMAEDNPGHNEVSSRKTDDQNLILAALTDDMVRAEHDHQHVDAVEDVHQLAECRHVEDVHVDISKYQNSTFLYARGLGVIYIDLRLVRVQA